MKWEKAVFPVKSLVGENTFLSFTFYTLVVIYDKIVCCSNVRTFDYILRSSDSATSASKRAFFMLKYDAEVKHKGATVKRYVYCLTLLM